MFSFEGWLSKCYAYQPVTFKMGIYVQCVNIASEINEKRIVATAARKIKNINLMPGPGRAKAARERFAIGRTRCASVEVPGMIGCLSEGHDGVQLDQIDKIVIRQLVSFRRLPIQEYFSRPGEPYP
jgi:hypothetical protein